MQPSHRTFNRPVLQATHHTEGGLVGHWIHLDSGGLGATHPVRAADFQLLRSLPWIASVTSLQLVVLAIHWQTVRDRGHEFLRLLEPRRPHQWQLCLEVDCPPSPTEACELMRFAF